MLTQTISLLFLLATSFISKSMYLEPPANVSEDDQSAQYAQEQFEDTKKEKELNSLIRRSSLKKQTAIKIAKLLAEQKILEKTLQAKLPTELNSYIAKFALIESLNPKSSKKCELPTGITITYDFLKSLYSLGDESEAFNNLDKLIKGIKLIDLSKTYHITINPSLTHWGKIDINPIDAIAHCLNNNFSVQQNDSQNAEFKNLIKYCVLYNNLDLLTYLNSITAIPFEDYTLESFDSKKYSILALAAYVDEYNAPMREFFYRLRGRMHCAEALGKY